MRKRCTRQSRPLSSRFPTAGNGRARTDVRHRRRMFAASSFALSFARCMTTSYGASFASTRGQLHEGSNLQDRDDRLRRRCTRRCARMGRISQGRRPTAAALRSRRSRSGHSRSSAPRVQTGSQATRCSGSFERAVVVQITTAVHENATAGAQRTRADRLLAKERLVRARVHRRGHLAWVENVVLVRVDAGVNRDTTCWAVRASRLGFGGSQLRAVFS